jgi:hypothetical protein
LKPAQPSVAPSNITPSKVGAPLPKGPPASTVTPVSDSNPVDDPNRPLTVKLVIIYTCVYQGVKMIINLPTIYHVQSPHTAYSVCPQ